MEEEGYNLKKRDGQHGIGFVECGMWSGIGVRKEAVTDNNSVQDSDNCPPVSRDF